MGTNSRDMAWKRVRFLKLTPYARNHYNFNILPYISFFWGEYDKGEEYFYLNIGWLNRAIQINFKKSKIK